MTGSEFFKGWLITGLSTAVIFNTYMFITDGKLKKDDDTWGDFFKGCIGFMFFGYLSAFFLFFILLDLLGRIPEEWVPITQKQADLATKALLYLGIFLFVGGILTECTAPREGAHCNDGTYSYATGQGACSWHGGVERWDKDYWWEND